MAKNLYEVRIRENPSPNRWVKKSYHYRANSGGEARSFYKGKGLVMWVAKVPTEKLLGIGSFFSLGDKLLKEFNGNGQGGGSAASALREEDREKKRKRLGWQSKQKIN